MREKTEKQEQKRVTTKKLSGKEEEYCPFPRSDNLKLENAYLRGKVFAYEKILKQMGEIK